jgi:hypothetical protein
MTPLHTPDLHTISRRINSKFVKITESPCIENSHFFCDEKLIYILYKLPNCPQNTTRQTQWSDSYDGSPVGANLHVLVSNNLFLPTLNAIPKCHQNPSASFLITVSGHLLSWSYHKYPVIHFVPLTHTILHAPQLFHYLKWTSTITNIRNTQRYFCQHAPVGIKQSAVDWWLNPQIC